MQQQGAPVPTDLCIPEFDSYRFVFWPIFVLNKHWCAGVHSTHDNSHLYYMDTWGNEVQVRSRIPTKLLETVNAFMNQ